MLSCTIRIMKLRVACIGVVAGLAALVCVGTVIHPAHAVPSGQAFSITPPLIELQADPGQTVNATLKLTNVSPSELLVKTQFNDFGPKNETGEPNIIFEDNKNTPYSLRRWFASPDPFTLKTAETRTLTFPIAVPKSAEPGGHYAVIRFTGSLPGVEDKGVALSASIGTLVLMRVSGNIQEKAALLDYFSATPKFDTSSFFEFSPVLWNALKTRVMCISSRPAPSSSLICSGTLRKLCGSMATRQIKKTSLKTSCLPASAGLTRQPRCRLCSGATRPNLSFLTAAPARH
jgi:hypothetical protein